MPLPKTITDLLEDHANVLKSVAQIQKNLLSDRLKSQMEELKASILKALDDVENEHEIFHQKNIIEKIWAFGPKKCGTNILLNLTDFKKHKSVWSVLDDSRPHQEMGVKDIRCDLESSFLNGYQLATLAGPLCEEPMHGVCFIVQDWQIDESGDANVATGQISGNNFICF